MPEGDTVKRAARTLDQALTGFQLAGQDFGPEPARGHLDEAGQVQRLRVQLAHRHLLALVRQP